MSTQDRWASGAAYERFMGRWSAPVAGSFLEWLDPAPGGRWLDVGCGTGALSARVLAAAEPDELVGVDPSAPFVEAAAERLGSERARFQVADAQSLPFEDDAFDAAVSGLVLNFVPDQARAAAELRRVVRPGGLVAAYVWDYAEGMAFLRTFWDAATALDPAAADLDEGARFSVTRRDGVAELFAAAGLREPEVTAFTAPVRFADVDDYWEPFLAGTGPAPGYVAGLSEDARGRLRAELARRLPREADGSISLPSRAWATRARSA